MPIYEYQCRECGREFEALVFGKECPSCPDCDSKQVCKLISACGFVSRDAGGQTVSASASSCSGCRATSCSSCGH